MGNKFATSIKWTCLLTSNCSKDILNSFLTRHKMSSSQTHDDFNSSDAIQEVFATCKQFSQTKESSHIQAQGVKTICTSFAKLSKAAHQHQVKLDISVSYHRLVQSIFGGDGFIGLPEVIDGLKKHEIEEPYKLLRSSILPGGDFFELVVLLQKDYVCYIPLESLPLAMFHNDQYTKQPKLPKYLKERTITCNLKQEVRLSAFELYIYYALTYSLRTAESSPLVQKESPFYKKFMQHLLAALFPIRTSTLEIPFLKAFGSDNQGTGIHIQRFFLDVFFGTWLKIDDGLAKPSPYCSQEAYPSVVPGALGLSLIRQVCLHFQCGIFNLLQEKEHHPPSLQFDFWQSIHSEFQPQLFHYLKAVFDSQTFTPELIAVVEFWLDYITPWNFVNFKDFSRCELYIVDHYLFYKQLLLAFLYRCLESHYLAESIGRYQILFQSEITLQKVLDVFCDDRVLKVLKEADATLNGIKSRFTLPFSFCPEAFEACFSSDEAISERFIYTLEAHLERFEDSPVFNRLDVSSRSTNWKQELHGVILKLATLCSPEERSKLFKTDVPLPTHWVYDSVLEFFKGLFALSTKKPTIRMAHDDYLTAHEYQRLAHQISKLLLI